MGTLSCCCCPIKIDELPEITKVGWTPTAWTLDEGACCAEMYLYPDGACVPVFVDGGDIDLNTETRTSSGTSWRRLYNNDILPGIWNGVSYDPPLRICNPCQEPFVCSTWNFSSTRKIATRWGLLYTAYRIKVRICYYQRTCFGVTENKYVLTSTFEYRVRGLFQKYMTFSYSEVIESDGCCTGGNTDSNTESDPNFTLPSFWGLTSFECPGALSTVFSVSRRKLYNVMPCDLGTVTFLDTDCAPCDDGLEFLCETEVCIITEGVSDPSFGGVTIVCLEREVYDTICTRATTAPCNSFWSFPSEDEDGDPIIVCQPFPPPTPTDPTCGPHSYTVKQIRVVGSGDTYTCPGPTATPPNLYPQTGISSAGCLSEPPCPGSVVRLADAWQEHTALSWDTFCSGGTTEQVCIDSPEWSIEVGPCE
jgi:hypothetical protein